MRIITSIAIFVCFGLTMANTDVSAQVSPPTNQPPNVLNLSDKYCAPSSIAISQAMVNQAASKRKEADSSVIIDPVIKMQMRTHELLTIIALEGLVTKCAILKLLDRGI